MHLIVLVILSLCCSLLIGLVSLLNSREMAAALETSNLASSALHNHMTADQAHDALRADVLAAVLAAGGNGGERKEVEKELVEHLAVFRKALKANDALPLPPEIAQGMQKVRPLVDRYLAESESIVKAAFEQPGQLETRMPKFKEAFSLLEKEMELVSDQAEKFESDSTTMAHAKAERYNRILWLVILASVLCFAVVAGLAIRSILGNIRTVRRAVEQLNNGTGDLNYRLPPLAGEFAAVALALNRFLDTLSGIIANVSNASGEIASAAEQIAGGNQDLAQRTTIQASSLEETAAAMEELIATVRHNADNAQQANDLAASASNVAARGGTAVSQVVATMGSINESARKIVDIISVIDGIAFQTNILALNAAVEAARAGEQGRGFAVVASEVRGLAQRSAAAAKEIKGLISDSVEKVDAGARLVDQAGKTMDEVVSSVRRVTDIISEITSASQEQSSGLALINQSISSMDKATQQNATLVEESAAAAGALHQQADGLNQVVAVFKVGASHVGGRGLKPQRLALGR
jgi:methyl-accepting chemotaxis protein